MEKFIPILENFYIPDCIRECEYRASRGNHAFLITIVGEKNEEERNTDNHNRRFSVKDKIEYDNEFKEFVSNHKNLLLQKFCDKTGMKITDVKCTDSLMGPYLDIKIC